mmetsp:Transcript_51556/g.92619  ORF Transcript_51556/g.92619 Transcript_51556/m.92619 type:complete len:232 (-) Transcript_51556:183-878(-)
MPPNSDMRNVAFSKLSSLSEYLLNSATASCRSSIGTDVSSASFLIKKALSIRCFSALLSTTCTFCSFGSKSSLFIPQKAKAASLETSWPFELGRYSSGTSLVAILGGALGAFPWLLGALPWLPVLAILGSDATLVVLLFSPSFFRGTFTSFWGKLASVSSDKVFRMTNLELVLDKSGFEREREERVGQDPCVAVSSSASPSGGPARPASTTPVRLGSLGLYPLEVSLSPNG